MSDVWLQGFNDGYDEGREQGQHEVRMILTDLIAAIQDQNHACCACDWADAAAATAESRLREITDDV